MYRTLGSSKDVDNLYKGSDAIRSILRSFGMKIHRHFFKKK